MPTSPTENAPGIGLAIPAGREVGNPCVGKEGGGASFDEMLAGTTALMIAPTKDKADTPTEEPNVPAPVAQAPVPPLSPPYALPMLSDLSMGPPPAPIADDAPAAERRNDETEAQQSPDGLATLDTTRLKNEASQGAALGPLVTPAPLAVPIIVSPGIAPSMQLPAAAPDARPALASVIPPPRGVHGSSQSARGDVVSLTPRDAELRPSAVRSEILPRNPLLSGESESLSPSSAAAPAITATAPVDRSATEAEAPSTPATVPASTSAPAESIGRKVGKIDPAISAEMPAAAMVENVGKIFREPSEAHKHSISEDRAPVGTRNAKSVAGMKFSSYSNPSKAMFMAVPGMPRVEISRVEAGEIGDFVRPATPVAAGDESASLPATARPGEVVFGPTRADAAPVGVSELPARDANLRPFSRAADLASALGEVHAGIEKIHSGKTTRLELELPMHEGRPVWVRLELHGAELKTIFRTDSPELRHALEQAWPQFSQRSQERGFPIGAATFESPAWQQDASQGQGGERQAPPREPFDFEPPSPRAAKSPVPQGSGDTAGQTTTSSLSLWA